MGGAIRVVAAALLVAAGLAPALKARPAPSGGADADGNVPTVQREGRWFVDGQDRVRLFHGVNAVWKEPPYIPPETAGGFTEADAEFLAEQGFNAVRLGVIFAGVMPQRGEINQTYLDEIERIAGWLQERGIWVLLDFHQDLYAREYGGEGFPAWATDDDGAPQPVSFGFPYDYAQPSVSRAFDNFWANTSGLQWHYRNAWVAVAERFHDEGHVLGYDVMNEPWPGSEWPTCAQPAGCPAFDNRKLQAFHQLVVDGIRTVDETHPVFVEPQAFHNFGAKGHQGQLQPFQDGNLGYSWHAYCLATAASWTFDFVRETRGCDAQYRATYRHARDDARAVGAAPLLTEFGGSDMLRDTRQALDRADASLMPWIMWAYKDWQGGDNQGLFQDDDEPDGPATDELKQGKADLYVRPYPQATAGTPTHLSFDTGNATLTLRYVPDPGATGPTEVLLPDRHYPHGYAAHVTGADVISADDARTLTLEARDGVDEVRLAVTPEG
jgi:endoglycosylceramidase